MRAARAASVLLFVGLATSCTLDLDRLRVGAGVDGGTRDAGSSDAGGDVRDATTPPDAGCSCGSGWQPSAFDVGGTGVGALDVVDLDGDGDDDIVASLIGDSIGAVILRMQAQGCFQAGLSVLGGTQRVSGTSADTRIAVGHWNADAFLDLAAPNPSAGAIEIHAGFVSGTSYSLNRIVTTDDLAVEDRPALAFTVDLDGRGERDDLVALGAMELGTARAGGEMASVFRVGVAARGVAFAPPNPEGAIGALAAGSAGVILLRYAGTSVTVGATLAPVTAASDVVDVLFVDLAGDSTPELVAADRGAQLLLVYRSMAGGESWGEPVQVPAGAVDAMAWGVFDAGGPPQIVTLVSARSAIDFYQWSGSDLATTASITSSSPTTLALGDVDGDARLDVVVGSSNVGAGRVTVYRRVCAGAGP